MAARYSGGMPTLTVSRDMAAPRDVVFAVLTDIEHAADFIDGIVKIEMHDPHPTGPMQVGTKWTETRIMMKKEATETMWVTALEPNASYTVEAKSHGMHYVTRITAEDGGEEKTRVTYVFTGTPLKFFAKLMTPMFYLFKGTAEKCFANDLADVETEAKSRMAVSSAAG